MQVTEKLNDGLKRAFDVVISASDISEKIDGRLEELGGEVKVPGFRPGKVPLAILRQRFGPSVMGEVLERAVNDSSSQAMNERGLRPAVKPKIEITAFDEGKDLAYSLEVELLPDIQPMDFSTVDLERIVLDIPDAEVDEAMQRLAASQKKTQPLAKPRKAKSGDVLIMDFAGTVHGEALPGMDAEDHHLELGTNSFIAGFEEKLIGVDAGETREVEVTFPEEYGNDKLAGQPAVFVCKIKEIHESVPAELDDDLAKSVGADDLADLHGKVREQVASGYESVARNRMKRDLLDKLADGHDYEVPPSMIDLEFEQIWKHVEEGRERGEVDPDDVGRDEDEVKAEYRQIAERRVRLGLLLSEVGRLNNIDVPQEEVNQAMIREAQRYPGQEQQVFQFYQSNPEALAQLRAPLFEDKVVDFIVDLAKVTERELTPEALRKEEEAEAKAEADKKAAKKPAAKKKAPAKKAAAEDSGAKDSGTDENQAAAKKPAAKKPAAKKPAAKKKPAAGKEA